MTGIDDSYMEQVTVQIFGIKELKKIKLVKSFTAKLRFNSWCKAVEWIEKRGKKKDILFKKVIIKFTEAKLEKIND